MTVPPAEPPPGDREAKPPGHDQPAPNPAAGNPPAREPTDSEVDATFAAIIAGWNAIPGGWSQDSPPAQPKPAAQPKPTARPPEPDLVEAEVLGAGDAEQEGGDEGHYEPPEPPPVPTLARATLGALALILLGAMLLIVPGVVGLASSVGFPLGLISVTGGLAWLLARLGPGPPTDSGWDDGAQI